MQHSILCPYDCVMLSRQKMWHTYRDALLSSPSCSPPAALAGAGPQRSEKYGRSSEKHGVATVATPGLLPRLRRRRSGQV